MMKLKAKATLGYFLMALKGARDGKYEDEQWLRKIIRDCFVIPDSVEGSQAFEKLMSICFELIHENYGFTEVWSDYGKMGKSPDRGDWVNNYGYRYLNTVAMTPPQLNSENVKRLIFNLLMMCDFEGDFKSHNTQSGEDKSVHPYFTINHIQKSDRKQALLESSSTTGDALANAEYYLMNETIQNAYKSVKWINRHLAFQIDKSTPLYDIEECDSLAVGGAYNIGNGVNGAVHVSVEFCLLFKVG